MPTKPIGSPATRCRVGLSSLKAARTTTSVASGVAALMMAASTEGTVC